MKKNERVELSVVSSGNGLVHPNLEAWYRFNLNGILVTGRKKNDRAVSMLTHWWSILLTQTSLCRSCFDRMGFLTRQLAQKDAGGFLPSAAKPNTSSRSLSVRTTTPVYHDERKGATHWENYCSSPGSTAFAASHDTTIPPSTTPSNTTAPR